MGKPLTDLLDAEAVAREVGLSKRTIVRRFSRHGAARLIAGRSYVVREGLRKALGDLYVAELEDLPAADAPRDDGRKTVTVSEAAEMWGVGGNAVRGAMRRLGVGITGGKKWLIPVDDLEVVKAGLLRQRWSLRTKKGHETHEKAMEIASSRAAGGKAN